jgi:hypothetical protein
MVYKRYTNDPRADGALSNSSKNGILWAFSGAGSMFKDIPEAYVSTHRSVNTLFGIYGTTYLATNFNTGVSMHSMRCLACDCLTRDQARSSRSRWVFSKIDAISVVDKSFEPFFFKDEIKWLAKDAAVSIALLPPCPVNGSN